MRVNPSSLIQPVLAEFSAMSVDLNYRNSNEFNKTFLHYLVEVGVYTVTKELLEKEIDNFLQHKKQNAPCRKNILQKT